MLETETRINQKTGDKEWRVKGDIVWRVGDPPKEEA